MAPKVSSSLKIEKIEIPSKAIKINQSINLNCLYSLSLGEELFSLKWNFRRLKEESSENREFYRISHIRNPKKQSFPIQFNQGQEEEPFSIDVSKYIFI